jgi:hypothetical protein
MHHGVPAWLMYHVWYGIPYVKELLQFEENSIIITGVVVSTTYYRYSSKKKNLTTDILNKATYLSAIQAAGKVLTYFVRFNYSLLANMSTYSNKTFSLFRSCVNDSWLRDLFSDHVIHSIRLEILLLYYVYGCAALTHICTSDLKIYQKPCHLFWLVVGSDSKPCPIT